MTPGPHGRDGARLQLLLVAEQLRRAAPGGIGTYIRGLAQGLRANGARGHVRVTAWASRATGPGGADPVAALGDATRRAALPGPALTRAWDAGLLGVPAGFDVCHATSLAVPSGRRTATPVTAFVHDLLWRTVPDAYPARGRRWHEEALARALHRAAHLLVPSRATADALLAAGADASRVTVVEEGCDHLKLAARHDGGYLLSVSTLEPRKNLLRLVDAYERARPRLPEPWPLRVVGAQGWSGTGGAAWPGAVPKGVELLGSVSDDELAVLLAGARALLYVPLEEGFGLPAVEAMRAGTPVLASPMPSTGGAAHEVDPLDVDAIATAIVTVAADERRRAELVGAGAARAGGLTWERAAAAHLAIWESLV